MQRNPPVLPGGDVNLLEQFFEPTNVEAKIERAKKLAADQNIKNKQAEIKVNKKSTIRKR